MAVCCERSDAEAVRVVLDFLPLDDPRVQKTAAKNILCSGDSKCIAVLKAKLPKRAFLLHASRYRPSVARGPAVALNLTSASELSEWPWAGPVKSADAQPLEATPRTRAVEGSSTFVKERTRSSGWFEDGFECSVEGEPVDDCVAPVRSRKEEALQQLTVLVEKTEMVG